MFTSRRCRDGQRAGAHKKEIAPSPTAAPARRGQLRAEHSASRKDRRGGAGLTRHRPAIGGPNGETPSLRRRRRRIKGRASGRTGEENTVVTRRTPCKRGRDRRVVRVPPTEDAGPGKPSPPSRESRLGNPASATSRLHRQARLHKPRTHPLTTHSLHPCTNKPPFVNVLLPPVAGIRILLLQKCRQRLLTNQIGEFNSVVV
ncbi:uncharacterized protein LOC128604938 [Ictalurus furcatus]|uniref:uncharacterized protein LOC128604938 n=1 Tax=Ictalurus furcatus TaxID=66913 RepID=UPI00235026E7|nr:uncharacterized protein LOC128604938 [Ictalurus furcatus]